MSQFQVQNTTTVTLTVDSRAIQHPCTSVVLHIYAVAGQVYVLNRDTASRLAISSPLEAHKSHAVIFHTCGVDVGFDNPIFAVSSCRHGEKASHQVALVQVDCMLSQKQ